jgi:hypothetical protein
VSENRWFPYTSDRWRNQPKSAVHFCTNNHVGMAGCTETWSTRFSDTLMLQIWAFRYFWPDLSINAQHIWRLGRWCNKSPIVRGDAGGRGQRHGRCGDGKSRYCYRHQTSAPDLQVTVIT